MTYRGFAFCARSRSPQNNDRGYTILIRQMISDNLVDGFHIKAGNHPNLLSAGMKVSMHQRT